MEIENEKRCHETRTGKKGKGGKEGRTKSTEIFQLVHSVLPDLDKLTHKDIFSWHPRSDLMINQSVNEITRFKHALLIILFLSDVVPTRLHRESALRLVSFTNTYYACISQQKITDHKNRYLQYQTKH